MTETTTISTPVQRLCAAAIALIDLTKNDSDYFDDDDLNCVMELIIIIDRKICASPAVSAGDAAAKLRRAVLDFAEEEPQDDVAIAMAMDAINFAKEQNRQNRRDVDYICAGIKAAHQV